MNFKKVISLLFVLLFGTTAVVVAANNNRNVYSVFSENFNGAHPDAGSSDEDAVAFQLWSDQSMQGETMTAEPIEGKSYSRLTNGTPNPDQRKWKYGGGGFVSTNSSGYHNMSAYYGGTIKFWARSSNSKMTNFRVGVKINNQEVLFPLSDLGFTANGQWQELTFTLSSAKDSRISSSNLSQTNILFMFNLPETSYVEGDYIEFDNVRWIQGSGGTPESFSVVTKNVSDNQETTDPISFSEDTFGQGWSVADQYVEIDIDGEFLNNNWAVRVYSNSNDYAGLININNTDDILPMAWKMSWTTLPFNYNDDEGSNANTLKIGENKDGEGTLLGLYDAGKVEIKGDGAKWWYPWFFVQKKSDTSANSLIVNVKGCHTFENTGTSGVTQEYFDTPESSYANTYERKPKLFFACNTKEAKAVQYTGSLIVSLSYE